MNVEKVRAYFKGWTAVATLAVFLSVVAIFYGNDAHSNNVERDIRHAELVTECIELGESPVDCAVSIRQDRSMW